MGFYNRFLLIAKRIYSNKKIIRLLIFLLIFFILFYHNKSLAVDNEHKVLSVGASFNKLNGVTYSLSQDIYSTIEPVHYFIYANSAGDTYTLTVINTDNISYNNSGLKYDTSAQRQSGSVSFNNTNHTWKVNYLRDPQDVYSGNYIMGYSEISRCVYSDITIYDKNGNPVFTPEPQIREPEIATSIEDLQTLSFDVLSVNGWSYSTNDLYLLCYDKNHEGQDSLYNLYAVNEILLNQQSQYFMSDLSSEPDTNSIYWIPREEIGFDWKVGGTYAFRFALRVPPSQPNDYTDWVYDYLTEPIVFTIDSNVSSSVIDDLNNDTQDAIRDGKIDNINNSISQGNQQNQQFYNNILSNDYNQNQAGDTLGGMTSSSDDIDDSQYTGLFSTIFGKFSNIINGDFSQVEEIKYPIPNTNQYITITSNILSSKIQGTFIYIFLQSFWLFLFGMYIFKFSNNLIRKIKDGSILNGYDNNNEVITSSML